MEFRIPSRPAPRALLSAVSLVHGAAADCLPAAASHSGTCTGKKLPPTMQQGGAAAAGAAGPPSRVQDEVRGVPDGFLGEWIAHEQNIMEPDGNKLPDDDLALTVRRCMYQPRNKAIAPILLPQMLRAEYAGDNQHPAFFVKVRGKKGTSASGDQVLRRAEALPGPLRGLTRVRYNATVASCGSGQVSRPSRAISRGRGRRHLLRATQRRRSSPTWSLPCSPLG